MLLWKTKIRFKDFLSQKFYILFYIAYCNFKDYNKQTTVFLWRVYVPNVIFVADLLAITMNVLLVLIGKYDEMRRGDEEVSQII